MSDISPPILVGPPAGIEVFPSLDAVQQRVEYWILFRPPGPSPAYDVEGRLLQFVDDETGTSPSGVTLRPAESVATHQDEARELLIMLLLQTDSSKSAAALDSLSLKDLFGLAGGNAP